MQVSVPITLLAALLVWSACFSAETDAVMTGAAAAPVVDVPTRYILNQVLDFSLYLTSTSVGGSLGRLDKRHTCEGDDISPDVQWDLVPETAESLVFMIEDPASDELGVRVDVLWNHWVVYVIPAEVTKLDVGQRAGDTIENSAMQGTNDFGKVQYSGPCPIPNLRFPPERSTGSSTIRPQRPVETAEERSYMFRLYALDETLALPSGADRDTVLEAIDGHIVAAGELAVKFKSRTSFACSTTDVELCLEIMGR